MENENTNKAYTPYREIAYSALTKWFGLSSEEARRLSTDMSVEDLESQYVYGRTSIESAIDGIKIMLGLTDEECQSLKDAVMSGKSKEDSEIFEIVAQKAQNIPIEQRNTHVLDCLSNIHDHWVENPENSTVKVMEKKRDKHQLRQYAPLELIGWNEVLSDLIFLEPILNSIGMEVNLEELEEEYHDRARKFFDKENIHSKNDIARALEKDLNGENFYPANSTPLKNPIFSDAIEHGFTAEQIVENMKKNDPKLLEELEQKNVERRKNPLHSIISKIANKKKTNAETKGKQNNKDNA